mgnify:CR=1 FL=1
MISFFAPQKIRPQIIAINHILIGANPFAETVIFQLQIRRAELTTDGLILCQLILGRSKLCYQRFDFCFQIGYSFLGFTQELFQLAFLLFLHDIFLRYDDKILKILFLNCHLR